MEKRIQMIASLSGDAISYAPDQVLVVGEDIEEGLAIAFCTDPPDDPRAKPLDGWDPWAAAAGEDEWPGSDSPDPDAEDEDDADHEVDVAEVEGAEGAAVEEAPETTDEPEPAADEAENAGSGLSEEDEAAKATEAEASEGADVATDAVEEGTPTEEGEPVDDEAEKREQETGAEHATAPAADQRETAEATPRRRGRKPKPPKDEEPPA